jgi:hypothetical protein
VYKYINIVAVDHLWRGEELAKAVFNPPPDLQGQNLPIHKSGTHRQGAWLYTGRFTEVGRRIGREWRVETSYVHGHTNHPQNPGH